MTTDDFTTTARAEADRQYWNNPNAATTLPGHRGPFTSGAVWARDHLAAQDEAAIRALATTTAHTGQDIVEAARIMRTTAQEATDDAVCDLIEDRLHDAMFTASVQEPDGEMTTYVDAPMAEVLRIVRDALTAAKEARR